MKFVHGWAIPSFDEHFETLISPEGRYQYENLKAAVSYCSRRRTVIDGGAHVGTWSKIFAKKFRRVLAFEPSPDTCECLRYNISSENVEIRNQALGKKAGMVSMVLDGFDGTLREKNAGSRYVVEGGRIERVSIDSLGLTDLDLLKLDIEGSEVDALHGAVRTLKRCRPVVIFEAKEEWVRRGYKARAPHEFLGRLGAVKFETVGIDEIWGWR